MLEVGQLRDEEGNPTLALTLALNPNPNPNPNRVLEVGQLREQEVARELRVERLRDTSEMQRRYRRDMGEI